MYLVYGSNLEGYSSILRSMEDAFLIMLGKANASEFILTYPLLGPIIYSSYNVVILYFALNIFISIITDAFDKLREEMKENPNELNLTNCLYLKLKKFFLKKSNFDTLTSPDKYKDVLGTFPEHINKLNEHLIRVYCFINQ